MTGREDIPAEVREAVNEAYRDCGFTPMPSSLSYWIVAKAVAALALRPSADHEAVRQRAVEDERDRLRTALRRAAETLEVCAGDRTPERFPETSYDVARRGAIDARAALRKPANEDGGEQ